MNLNYKFMNFILIYFKKINNLFLKINYILQNKKNNGKYSELKLPSNELDGATMCKLSFSVNLTKIF